MEMLLACNLCLNQCRTQWVFILFIRLFSFLRPTHCGSPVFSGFVPNIFARGLSHNSTMTPRYRSRLRVRIRRIGWWGVFLRPSLRCSRLRAAQTLIFRPLIAPVGVLLSSPLPSCAEWSLEIFRRDVFILLVTEGSQHVFVSCQKKLVYRVVICQTHTATTCIRARRWWRSLSDIMNSTIWTLLSISWWYFRLRYDWNVLFRRSPLHFWACARKRPRWLSRLIEKGWNVADDEKLLLSNRLKIFANCASCQRFVQDSVARYIHILSRKFMSSPSTNILKFVI